MNLILRDGDKAVFRLSGAEKSHLFRILGLYPLVPAQHHKSSRGASSQAATNHHLLLEEALEGRRRENQRQLTELLTGRSRFVAIGDEYHVTLTDSEVEWLLQVLNDVRVGCWIALGEPDNNSPKPVKLSGNSAVHYAAMEFCGYVEMALLDAFRDSK